jgi:hypothetical protein
MIKIIGTEVTANGSGNASNFGLATMVRCQNAHASTPHLVTLQNKDGAGATLTVTRSGTTVGTIGVSAGGSGYGFHPFGIPPITITGGSGSGATATATVVNGVITAVTVTNAGTGYSTDPTIAATSGTTVDIGTFTLGGNQTEYIDKQIYEEMFAASTDVKFAAITR